MTRRGFCAPSALFVARWQKSQSSRSIPGPSFLQSVSGKLRTLVSTNDHPDELFAYLHSCWMGRIGEGVDRCEAMVALALKVRSGIPFAGSTLIAVVNHTPRPLSRSDTGLSTR